jgi:hypothetical protein
MYKNKFTYMDAYVYTCVSVVEIERYEGKTVESKAFLLLFRILIFLYR